MVLILKKSQADAFIFGMEELGRKFNDRQLQGKIDDYVKLTCIDGKTDLVFIKPVPEMVRIACYMCFVNTIL